MKYRIIKKTIPELTKNWKGVVDFIPEIEYITTYVVQCKESIFFPWFDINWSYNIEQAKVYIEYKQTKTQIKIIKKY
jgi:hypothetical protein